MTLSNKKTIGAFGMMSENKQHKKIIKLCADAGCKIVGQFATLDRELASDLETYAKSLNVEAELYFDFADEEVVYQRLEKADAMVSIQRDIEHYATSGSIRFLMSMGKPVFCNKTIQYNSVEDGVVYIDEQTGPKLLEYILNSQEEYSRASKKCRDFCKKNYIGNIYKQLLEKRLCNPDKVYIPDYPSLVLRVDGKTLNGSWPTVLLKPGSDNRKCVNIDPYLWTALNEQYFNEYQRATFQDKSLTIEVMNQYLDNAKDSQLSRLIILNLLVNGEARSIRSRYCNMEAFVELLAAGNKIYVEHLMIARQNEEHLKALGINTKHKDLVAKICDVASSINFNETIRFNLELSTNKLSKNKVRIKELHSIQVDSGSDLEAQMQNTCNSTDLARIDKLLYQILGWGKAVT